MIQAQYINVLRKILSRLEGAAELHWALTGSLGMALQGMEVQVHDIDIQTDPDGAYEIERRLSEYVIQPVHCLTSERLRSHFGVLEIDGIKMEIMGGLQKRLGDDWEAPVDVRNYRRWLEVDGMPIPVLALDYEYQAYLKLGRVEKAAQIKAWLDKSHPA